MDAASALKVVETALGEGPAEAAPGALSPTDDRARSPTSQHVSQTAADFIGSQEALEAEARDVLPYSFDVCTKEMGPLRQSLYACLTCNPPPENPSEPYKAAGVCYACSISCHGEHELVELFSRRNFTCDCGTTRLPDSVNCALRIDPATETRGVHSEEPAATNSYNKNFRNRFCVCDEFYDPQKQKGTMFQCIGLVTEEEGGCGEDWWHPECLMGLPRDWEAKPSASDGRQPNGPDGEVKATTEEPIAANEATEEKEHPIPPGFPAEESFDHMICYKCVEKVPFLKRYAGFSGFIGLPNKPRPDLKSKNEEAQAQDAPCISIQEEEIGEGTKKRSRDEAEVPDDTTEPAFKRARSVMSGVEPTDSSGDLTNVCKYINLPPAKEEVMSILLPEDFREKLCRCKDCYSELRAYPMLLEEEETYEPPLSEAGDANGGGSVGTGSLLERGEAALSSVDRVRAIEGVMVYNHLKDKVKDFLKPFAENGKMVSAEEIKAYFEKLRGDHEAIRDARTKTSHADSDDEGGDSSNGGNRREQSGY